VEVPHTLFRGAMIPGLCGTGLRLNDDGVSTTAAAVAATMAPAGTDRSIDRRTKGLGFTIERSMISTWAEINSL
jgi:hypothetical protein